MFSDPIKNIEQFGVDPGMKVADLGSGAGFYSLEAAKIIGGSGKVYAVDVQQELLVKLKNEARQQSITNIEILWGDIDEMGGSRIQDSAVERVIIANVLFQTDDKETVVKEANRILKPEGMILLVDWSDSFGGLGPQPSRIISEEQGRALFENQGFEFVRDIQAGAHHYGMVFKK